MKQAASLLNASLVTVEYWVAQGHIPRLDTTAHKRYPLEFIRSVAAFSRDRIGRGDHPNILHVRVCRIAWDYAHVAPEGRRYVLDKLRVLQKSGKVSGARAAARHFGLPIQAFTRWREADVLPSVRIGQRFYFLTENLVQIGKLYSVLDTAKEVGYSRTEVALWIRHGVVPAVTICGRYFVRESDVWRLKEVSGWLTTYEVEQELHISRTTITREVLAGKLVAISMPMGLRFDPEEIALEKLRRAQAVEEEWTAPKVTKELGISQTTLLAWTKAGVIRSRVVSLHRRLYDAGDVRRVKREQWALQPAFDWMPDPPERQRSLVNSTQAARLLHVDVRTLATWAEQGLVPCHRLAPPAVRAVNRQYPQSYIVGLAAYAPNAKVTMADVVRYLARCKQQHLSLPPKETPP